MNERIILDENEVELGGRKFKAILVMYNNKIIVPEIRVAERINRGMYIHQTYPKLEKNIFPKEVKPCK